MNTNQWIFISPHLDDVALSCGGLIWDLTRAGHTVAVWTLMAGTPTDENYSPFAQRNHRLWGISGREAIHARREEDRAACALLGAEARHFDWPDAIYRRDPHTGDPIVNNNEALFNDPPETSLVDEITAVLQAVPPGGSRLVFPIGLGGHIDHQAVVRAGDRLDRVECYYADYPYILKNFDSPGFREGLWKSIPHFLDQAALDAWCEAVLCYASQLSTFWRDAGETRLALRNYLAGGGGRLWHPVNCGERQGLGNRRSGD